MRTLRHTTLAAALLVAGPTVPAAAQGAFGAMKIMKQVRATPSPYAGTYRITMSQDADTVTFYARSYGTASIPLMNMRAEGTSDLDRAGAFVMGYSALTPEALPTTADVSKEARKQLGGLMLMVGWAFPTADSTTVVPGLLAAGLPKGQSVAYDRMSATLERLNRQMQDDMRTGKPKRALAAIRFDAGGAVHVHQTLEADGKTVVSSAERIDDTHLGQAPGMF